jgi:hypothetical protein
MSMPSANKNQVFTHAIKPISYQFAEEVIFRRLLKNAQMQGARNPEE